MRNLFSPTTSINPITGRISRGLMALGLALLFVGFSPKQVDAAGTIAACFRPMKQNSAAAISIPYSLVDLPVTVHALYNGLAYNVTPTPLKLAVSGTIWGLPNGTGCLVWSVPPSLQQYPLRVVMNYSYSPAYYLADVRWSAVTPFFAPAGSGTHAWIDNAYCIQGC